MRALALVLLVLALPAQAEVEPATFERLNTALADDVALPAYQAYADAAGTLEPALAPVCAGDASALPAAKDAFRAMALAWQHAQPIALGPATDGHGRARVHWWPDARGTGERQLRRLLFEADDASLTAERIEGSSVALKGLSALEWLLFEQDLATAPFTCSYTQAVAAWQADLGQRLVRDWAAFRDDLAAAEAGSSAAFYDAADAAQAWLKSLLETLDLIVRDKLERPLGPSLESAKGRLAELDEAGLALPAIIANLETLRAFLAVPGGFADALAAAGSGALGDGLVRVADDAIAQASGIELPLADAVVEAEARARVVALLDEVKRLRLLAGGGLAGDLGLVTGFNAADGD